MALAIETSGLSKSYGAVQAVNSVSLRVEQGEIYGFIGRNGAGKTTTIRALLGMIQPSAGSVSILQQLLGPHGRGPWRRVGHLVDEPAAYPELSVWENLEIARRLQGIPERQSTARAVERLGLGPYVERKARTLSSGNLKRLGLARALLHEPELLILDEPANGLDPAGVVEIRDLLAGLVQHHGVTVFMSSHILTEVDRLATRIGIIHQGILIEEIGPNRLETLRSRCLEIVVRHPEVARRALAEAGFAYTAQNGALLLSEAAAVAEPDRVATILVNAGAPPTHLAVQQEDLETYFLRLTGGAP